MKFKKGQLLKIISGPRKKLYLSAGGAEHRLIVTFDYLHLDEYFILLDVVEHTPKFNDDDIFYIQILYKEQIRWTWICENDCQRFVVLENGILVKLNELKSSFA